MHLTVETGRHRETSGRHDPEPTAETGDTGRQADTTPEPASQHLASDRRDWETGRQAGKPLEPASQHLASDRRDWETGRHVGDTTPEPTAETGDTWRQAGDWETWRHAGDTTLSRRHSIWHLPAETGRHRETSWETTLGPASQHLASDRRDWETGRHAGDTTPEPTAETGDTWRQAGDTTPEPASQHLASDRRDWETQGDKLGNDPGANVTASGSRPERLGDRKTSGKQDPGTSVTLSHSRHLKLEPQRFAVWGQTW